MSDEEYGYSKTRLIWLIGLTIVMVAVSLAATRHKDSLIRAIAWSGVAFFSLGFPATIKGLRHRGPVLTLTAEGFTDVRNGFGLIPWSAIRDAWIGRVYGQPLVSIDLFDPEPFLTRLSPFARQVALSNRAMGFSPLTLSAVGLTVTADDLAAAIRRRLSDVSAAPAGRGAAWGTRRDTGGGSPRGAR